MKTILKVGVASAALLASAGFAQASDCADILSLVAQNPEYEEFYRTHHPECFVDGTGSGPSVSHQQTIATSFRQMSTISDVIGARMLVAGPASARTKKAELPALTGLAAGNGGAWNAWTSAARTSAKYDGFGAANTGMYESEVWNLMVGGDYRLASNLLLGLSAAMDSGEGQVGTGRASSSTEGYAFAPYLGWQINENLAMDFTVGLGAGEATLSTSETDSDRFFYGANLNYARWMGELQLSARLGYMGSVEDNDDTTVAGVALAGTGGKNRLDQLRFGVQAGYWLLDGVMPYLGVSASHDLRRTTLVGEDWDENAFQVSVGTNFMSLATGTTLGISYTHELGRSSTESNTLMANLNIRF